MRDAIPEPGDVLADKYLIEHVIGRGGMGTVFAAVHLLTEKRLAIKCLLPQHMADEAGFERFMREARAAGRIQHRHVIDVFDVGSSQGVPFLVMPRLEGKSLTELLCEEGLTLDHVLVVMIRAMEGVHAAHRLDIIHRDLKPCNIFVCQGVSGRLDDPRVLDFGISKVKDDADGRLTKSGAVVGTPYYMALEQLTGRRDIDCRADIYSVGVILYEAMAGKPPHDAENAAGLAIQLMHVPPKHLAQLRPDLPEGLAEVVMQALARDREERFKDMTAFIAALLPYTSSGDALASGPLGPKLRTPADAKLSSLNVASKTTAPNTAYPPSEETRAEAQPSALPGSLSNQRKVKFLIMGAGAVLAAGLVVFTLPRGLPVSTHAGERARTEVNTGGGSAQEATSSSTAQQDLPLAAVPQKDADSPDARVEPQHKLETAVARKRTGPQARRAQTPALGRLKASDASAEQALGDEGATPLLAPSLPAMKPLRPNDLDPAQF